MEAQNDCDHRNQPSIQSGCQRCKEGCTARSGLYYGSRQARHVLLTIDDYHRLTGGGISLAAALAQRGENDFEFDPPRVGSVIKPADLG